MPEKHPATYTKDYYEVSHRTLIDQSLWQAQTSGESKHYTHEQFSNIWIKAAKYDLEVPFEDTKTRLITSYQELSKFVDVVPFYVENVDNNLTIFSQKIIGESLDNFITNTEISKQYDELNVKLIKYLEALREKGEGYFCEDLFGAGQFMFGALSFEGELKQKDIPCGIFYVDIEVSEGGLLRHASEIKNNCDFLRAIGNSIMTIQELEANNISMPISKNYINQILENIRSDSKSDENLAIMISQAKEMLSGKIPEDGDDRLWYT